MEMEILQKLNEQEKKIDKIFEDVEKIRKYFLWTFIVTIVTIVLPILALAFIIPWIFSNMSSAFGI